MTECDLGEGKKASVARVGGSRCRQGPMGPKGSFVVQRQEESWFPSVACETQKHTRRGT